MTKGIFNLNLDEREPRGFSTSEPKLWRPKGFSTLILMKGNQGAFQPQNRSYGDQGAFQPRNRAVATKGIFNLDLNEREPRGFSTSILMKGN